jgi:hypothetical protein
MKIKMLTLDAGPDGVREPGKIYEVPNAEAKQLIAGGYAVDATHLDVPKRRGAPEQAVSRRGKVATETDDGDQEE